MADHFIGQIAKAANLNIGTLRYYEKNGLLPVPERTEGGYRVYETSVLNRLEFIRHAKSAGFTLSEIKHLLFLLDGKNVDLDHVSGLIGKKMEEVEQKISEYTERLEFLRTVRENLPGPERCSVLEPLMKGVQINISKSTSKNTSKK